MLVHVRLMDHGRMSTQNLSTGKERPFACTDLALVLLLATRSAPYGRVAHGSRFM